MCDLWCVTLTKQENTQLSVTLINPPDLTPPCCQGILTVWRATKGSTLSGDILSRNNLTLKTRKLILQWSDWWIDRNAESHNICSLTNVHRQQTDIKTDRQKTDICLSRGQFARCHRPNKLENICHGSKADILTGVAISAVWQTGIMTNKCLSRGCMARRHWPNQTRMRSSQMFFWGD